MPLTFVEEHQERMEQTLLDELSRLGAPQHVFELIYSIGYFRLYHNMLLTGRLDSHVETDFDFFLKTSLSIVYRVDLKAASGQLLNWPRTPDSQNIVDIIQKGETQIYEFKRAGVLARKLVKEIAAMLNTNKGGIILYGVDDDGKITGADISKQALDQRINNSLRTSVVPSAVVRIESVSVASFPILMVIVPAWDGKRVYQYEGRILVRKGTNVFVAEPDEARSLYQGRAI